MPVLSSEVLGPLNEVSNIYILSSPMRHKIHFVWKFFDVLFIFNEMLVVKSCYANLGSTPLIESSLSPLMQELRHPEPSYFFYEIL